MFAVAFQRVTAEQDPRQLAAKRLREEHRLQKVGVYWIVPLEAEIRRGLRELNEELQSLEKAERKLQQLIHENRRRWNQLKPVRRSIARLVAETKKLSTDDPRRLALEAEIARRRRLLSGAVDPPRLGTLPVVRAAVIEITSARHELYLRVDHLREQTARLGKEYAQRSADPAILRDLQTLGGQAQLGPARNYLTAPGDRRLIAEALAAALAPRVPVYLLGEKARVAVLLNDEVPVTLTWNAQARSIRITSNMAAAAGIEVPREAPRRTIVTADKRRLRAREVEIDSLRLGSLLLAAPKVLVLPPEGEDLGGQIGPAAFEKYTVRLKLEQLRLETGE